MINPGAQFASITAMLEDMHGVAVNGQAKDLTSDEGAAFVAILRIGIARLERQIASTSEAFDR